MNHADHYYYCFVKSSNKNYFKSTKFLKMKRNLKNFLIFQLALLMLGCGEVNKTRKGADLTAADILGNPEYLAMSYGGYREKTREVVPTIDELKEDMLILSAMGIKLLRTYNTQQFAHAANLLEAISQLKDEDPNFEMYVMVGVWIDCEDAWTKTPNHNSESLENNTAEIEAAVKMANQYPDIVKVIAVGNEAMVQWAANYFVYPNVILKWVNYLRDLRERGELPAGLWITSSDNYESWGGKSKTYHTEDLAALVKAVDFISLHTYPFHETHYDPAFWAVPEEEENLTAMEQIEAAMLRAKEHAIAQYQGTADYVASLGIEKPIHIGETGWASISGSFYGPNGSNAADEYKEKLYYQHMRDWTNANGMSCFYFEAFDEQWKDEREVLGSENHFGLIKLNGQAKFALWDMVEQGVFDGLTRNGQPITKTYNGDQNELMKEVLAPPVLRELGLKEITTVNPNREAGQPVTENTYVVVHETKVPDATNNMSYASDKIKLNPWEGTCDIKMSREGVIEIKTGTGDWWGCAAEIAAEKGENMTEFKSGKLHFDIKGNTGAQFQIGFQTGTFLSGTQKNNSVMFNSGSDYSLADDWKSYSIALADLDQGADLSNVTALLFLRADDNLDGKTIYLKNIYYSK